MTIQVVCCYLLIFIYVIAFPYKIRWKVNDGEVNSYASEGNNEPIIPEEMFNKVQEERTRRSNVEIGEDGIKRRKATKYSAIKAD